MSTTRTVTGKYIEEVTVRDPDSGGDVQVEIWKDPESGGLFGIDSSYFDQVGDSVVSPFNNGTLIQLPERNMIMGRSHSWNRPVDMDKALFRTAKKDFAKLLPELRKRVPDLIGIEGVKRPVVADHGIFFTLGNAEWFVFACMTPPQFRHRIRPGATTITNFVKTFHNVGYDLAVMSCLLIFKHHFGEALKIGSDAEIAAWEPAIEFVKEYLGYTENWEFQETRDGVVVNRYLEMKEAA